MIDREKVYKGLHKAWKTLDEYSVNGTPFDMQIVLDRIFDALELLKEHGTEWEHLWDAPDGTFKGRCKKCGFVHFFIEGHDTQYKFCPECGRLVKRNDSD